LQILKASDNRSVSISARKRDTR